MSVINQVLNQIEKRGGQGLAGQSLVRAVPPRRDMRKLRIALLVMGAVLAIGFMAWQWQQSKKRVIAPTSNVQVKPVTVIAAPASGTMGEPMVETLASASRLSSELSTVSSPSFSEEKNNFAEPAKPSGLSTRPLLSLHSSPVGQATTVPTRPSNEFSKPPPSRRGTSTPTRTITSERPLDESDEPMQMQGGLPKKQISPAQQAEAEFHKASELAQRGSISDALAGYEAALRLNPGYDKARQALVALLLESKRGTDAERILHEGIKNRPEQVGFAMLLARLQVERGAVGEALATLDKSLPFADRQADYQAFLAALLQRQNRHNEAVAHYEIVLQLAPNNGIWLMGYGISLRAVQRNAEAKDAFKRALETQMLSPELREFVQQKLKGL